MRLSTSPHVRRITRRNEYTSRVFGWGMSRRSPLNIEAFAAISHTAGSWLAPFNGFGPDNFLQARRGVQIFGLPGMDRERFCTSQLSALADKMDLPTLYAVGLLSIAGAESWHRAGVTGARPARSCLRWHRDSASLSTLYDASVALARIATALGPFLKDREAELRQYLDELARIDGLTIGGRHRSRQAPRDREKEKSRARLQEKWAAPEPPWNVSANVIWNIHNTQPRRFSILGKITGFRSLQWPRAPLSA